jgi:hypothetical protein
MDGPFRGRHARGFPILEAGGADPVGCEASSRRNCQGRFKTPPSQIPITSITSYFAKCPSPVAWLLNPVNPAPGAGFGRARPPSGGRFRGPTLVVWALSSVRPIARSPDPQSGSGCSAAPSESVFLDPWHSVDIMDVEIGR